MGDAITAEVEGLKEIKNTLVNVAPKEAKAILRRTMVKSAAEIRNAARRRVRRRTGTLRKAIVSKRDRGTPTSIESSVWVKHGKGVKNDAFYWHMIEWGTLFFSGTPFLTPSFVRGKSGFFKFFKVEFFRQLVKQMKKRGARA